MKPASRHHDSFDRVERPPMNNKLRTVMAVIACFTTVGPFAGVTRAQDAPTATKSEITFDVIKEAWIARQKRFFAAKFTLVLDQKTSKLKFAESSSHGNVVELDPTLTAKLASEYIEFQQQVQLSISGPRIHYRQSGMSPGGRGDLFFTTRQSASDGVTSMILYDKNDNVPYPNANILRHARSDAEVSVYFEPIVWTFGDLEATLLALKQPKVKASSAATVVNSQSCVVLEAPISLGSSDVRSFWMDPSKDYVVVRRTHAANGAIVGQLDCSYTKTAQGCWVPTEWTETSFYRRTSITTIPRYIVHAAVKDVLVNPTFSADEFSIAFPPGTVVGDDRADARSTRADLYVTKPDGSKRIITGSEGQASYEQLAATESGQAMKAQPIRYRWAWVGCGLLLIGLLTGVFVLRRRLKSRNS